MQFENSLRFQKKFNDLIPGGSHTYAKGDDQFPEFMPAYITRGKGCRIWDADGNEYIEYGNGLRSVSLGHAFEPIVEAACKQMHLGTNFGRPSVLELESAEAMLSILEGADMVKFCKNGSDANDAAIKLARAFTGRKKIGICASHPFFSINDWFIGITPIAAGIPSEIKDLSLCFYYNDLASAERLFRDNPGEIACLILEPEKYEAPRAGFLYKLKELCHRNGALLILDEMITGFRWHLSGAQKIFGITPDLSTWGKALANGFAITALTGKKEIMELGGLAHKKERVFLLSTTHGAETHSLAAAMATIKFYKEHDVIGRLHEQGKKLEVGIRSACDDLGITNQFQLCGPPCGLIYSTNDHEGNCSQLMRSLFLQETMRRGLIMPSLFVSYSHTDADIRETCEKVHAALAVYKKALCEGVAKYLHGRSIKPVWRKFNHA
jgi:glutamate-1-semialdehyde 2,1-aminomutase